MNTLLKTTLGNTRLTVQDSSGIAAIKQENHYYPFGMVIAGQSWQSTNYLENRYLYNGKEFQDNLGLDWYDYGARFYDALIGRWHSIDRLSEKFRKWSPYTYVLNNPINKFDPNGEIPISSLITGSHFYPTDITPRNRFGMLFHPILHYWRPHNGLDFWRGTFGGIVKEGQGIRSFARGKIIKVATSGGFGNYIKIDHGEGYVTTYAHLKELPKLKEGKRVENGQLIGILGSSGLSTEVHLHFELHKDGKPIDPMSIYDLDEYLY